MTRRFSYEGDHAEVALFGATFPQGVPVEVAGDHACAKLAGNSHFKEHFYEVQAAVAAPPAARKKPGPKPKVK